MFGSYLKSKYKVADVNELRFKTHHYEDISGTIIDNNTYTILNEFNKITVMIYDYEEKLNEQRRNIKLLSKTHVSAVLNEFTVRTQEIKNNRRLFKSE